MCVTAASPLWHAFPSCAMNIGIVRPMLLSPGILGLNPGTVPPRDNYFYVVHAYIEIFTKQLFGYGSALLWLLFAVVLGLTVLLFKTSRRWVFYGVEP